MTVPVEYPTCPHCGQPLLVEMTGRTEVPPEDFRLELMRESLLWMTQRVRDLELRLAKTRESG